MILISHRGNVTGPCPDMENTVEYIEKALSMGYDCELDVWKIDDEFYLGHDGPQRSVSLDFLRNNKDRLWVHCKNVEAISPLISNDIRCFTHDKDPYTLTSKQEIWGNIDQALNCNTICVMPERYTIIPSIEELECCKGICSDHIHMISAFIPSR